MQHVARFHRIRKRNDISMFSRTSNANARHSPLSICFGINFDSICNFYNLKEYFTMVKLTPELINASMQYINPCRDRELDLRGKKCFSFHSFIQKIKGYVDSWCLCISEELYRFPPRNTWNEIISMKISIDCVIYFRIQDTANRKHGSNTGSIRHNWFFR